MARISRKKTLWLKLPIFLLLFVIGSSVLIQTPIIQKVIYPYPYRGIIESYAEEYGVDPYLVVAVIREESKFIPASESNKGAQGLMQLMPTTAEWIAGKLEDKSYTIENLRDPSKNIQYGTWYLANLDNEFKGNLTLILAAYNGGRGHVKEWINNEQLKLENLKVSDIPFEETRNYVIRVLKSYERYHELYQK